MLDYSGQLQRLPCTDGHVRARTLPSVWARTQCESGISQLPMPCLEAVRRHDDDAALIVTCVSGDDFEDQSQKCILCYGCDSMGRLELWRQLRVCEHGDLLQLG